jgi:hypothetical protein
VTRAKTTGSPEPKLKRLLSTLLKSDLGPQLAYQISAHQCHWTFWYIEKLMSHEMSSQNTFSRLEKWVSGLDPCGPHNYLVSF